MKIGNFTRKSHTKIIPAQSMEITSMTTADFGNKQVVLNQSNSKISRVITVLQSISTWGARVMPKFSSNFPKSENNVGTALQTVHMIQLW
jgi:hypothetical protein